MPKMDKFLIAPFETGLQTNLRPWQIMDDAFEYLQNCYVFRGRVTKRFGSTWMGITALNSRLRVSIGTTPGPINLPGNASQLAIGQLFSVGADIFTVYQLGAGVLTLSTNAGATATIDSTTNPNTVTFTGEPGGTAVYYYPATPVMGIAQYESGAINNHPTYAFDTQFVYLFTAGFWERSGAAIWHGTDYDFFWTCNWQGNASVSNTGTPVFFVTNFNFTVPAPAATDDPIWYTPDGANWTALSGANAFYFAPAGGAIHTGPYVKTCRIIVAFKNRLVLLNTVENNGGGGGGTNTNYVNRCRYSINGSPFAANAWYEPNQTDNVPNVAAGAGFIDAATEEQIITAEFIKDRLIVYFERSTWELAYTGNEILPFVWQKINTELGSQSTFSTVPFDKEVLTIGNSGIHSCSGANVQRIDDKIPQEVFTFKLENNNELRTCGIRDYVKECVYWSFVADTQEVTQGYPNQVLVYNYKNQSWAINDDCFTAFGYFEQQSDTTWASSAPTKWFQANQTWDAGVNEAQQRQILGGNQEGFVVLIKPDTSINAQALQITNITYNGDGTLELNIINHNFADSVSNDSSFGSNDYISLDNIVADATTEATLNGAIFPVTIVDANNITIDTNLLYPPTAPLLAGTYYGGGTGARVSNVQLLTKQFNPYDKDNTDVYVSQINFAVLKTIFGEITVDYFPSASENSMIAEGTASTAIMGNNILETSAYDPTLYPFESQQTRLWHPIYFQSIGECIQIAMYFSQAQMMDFDISGSDFELDGMLLVTQRADRRLQ